MTVSDIVRALDAWAPPGQKADFDRVGLQVGDPHAVVDRVLVALDLTPGVVDEAVESGAGLIVTHHPLLFQPAQRVTADDPVGGLVWRLAAAGIAYYAIHTNLDATWGGVSFALADQLGLRDVRLLAPLDGVLRKVVVFAPEASADRVRHALAEAGAGRVGSYVGCSFTSAGTGRFTPTASATPTIGTAGGGEETVAEVPRLHHGLDRVLAAVRAAHPYEEPALDVTPIEAAASRQGYGAVGDLDAAEPLPDFLSRVSQALGAEALRYVGTEAQTVRTVAVCGGSGMSFFSHALRAGAHAYVTSDVTYHRFFEALDGRGRPRIALVDAGHYETEAVTERLIVDRLRSLFPGLAADPTRHRTSPMRTFARGR